MGSPSSKIIGQRSVAQRTPKQRNLAPLSNAGVVGNQSKLVNEGRRDNQLIRRVLVKAGFFQCRDPLDDGWRYWQNGEFRCKRELKKFGERHR